MRRLRKQPCVNLSPIYFLVEGRKRAYKCDCGAREFEIGEAHASGYTTLTCSYRKRHVVISGFTVGEIDYEQETVWLGKPIRGVQLPFNFSEWITIGKPKKQQSRWRTA
jgi:hypothetical protein